MDELNQVVGQRRLAVTMWFILITVACGLLTPVGMAVAMPATGSASGYATVAYAYDHGSALSVVDLDRPERRGPQDRVIPALSGGSALLSGFGIAAKAESGLIRARDVRFTQDSAGAMFKDGRSVFDLGEEMAAAGRAPSSMPPIRIFEREGNLHSLDNRRLFAGQYADINLPYRLASPSEIAARNQTQIFGGTSIDMRMGGGVRAWWQP